MTKQDRVHAELESMQIFSLSVLWRAAYRWMETAAGRGLGKDMAPHQRINARRIAQRCLTRYFDAIDKTITTQDFLWPTRSITKK